MIDLEHRVAQAALDASPFPMMLWRMSDDGSHLVMAYYNQAALDSARNTAGELMALDEPRTFTEIFTAAGVDPEDTARLEGIYVEAAVMGTPRSINGVTCRPVVDTDEKVFLIVIFQPCQDFVAAVFAGEQ